MRTQPYAKYFFTADRALENARQRLCSATTTHSQLLTTTLRLSRFLTALTNEKPQTNSRSLCILFDTAESPAHCKHLYGNNKSRNIRSSKQPKTNPLSMWARYLIRGRLSRFCAEWRLLLLPRVPKRVENLETPTQLSHHSLSHTPTFSQPSRSHPRPLPARNSALLLISSAAVLIGGFVFSWGRPGSE